MMMNPTMNRIEQLDNFQDSIQSTEAIDRLRAMQGLRGLPTVQMEKGQGIMEALKEKIMGSEEEEEGEDLEDILEKVKEAKDDIPFYQIGKPLDLSSPGYVTDEMIEKMNKIREINKRIKIEKDSDIDDIDKFIYKIRELPEREERGDGLFGAGSPKLLIDDIKARGKDKKYQKLLETLARLRNPESAEEGEKQIDIENALAELYPDMIASKDKRVLSYIPGDVTQDRYGVRSVRGNLPSILVNRKEGGSIADTAENLASYGRFGDSVLLHVRPDELQGLMSLGNITYNPITGLPEAFSLKSITKPFRNIAKSKAFKVIAPIAIGLAAPYLLGPAQLGLFSTYAGGMGAVNYGLASAIGGGLGALAAGRRGSDVFKQAALTGVTAGAMKGLSNYGQQRALAKGLEADAAAKATSGSTNLQAGTSNVQGNAYVASTPESMALNAPGGIPSQTAYVDSATTFGAPDNLSTYSNVSDAGSRQLAGLGSDIRPISGAPTAVEPNYMAQAKSILAADPTAGTTFNIGKGGISEAAAQEQLQASVNRPFTERLMDSAVSFDDKGGINVLGTAGKLAKAVAPGELAGTAIDMENAMEEAERAEEEAARAQLAQMDYEIDTGFGGQTVIRDPSGVVLPAYLSSQDILDIALGRKARPRLVPGTQFAATRDVVTAEEGTPGGLQGVLDKAKMLFTRGYEDDEEDTEMSDVDEANEIETQEILNQYYKVVKENPYEVEEIYGPGTSSRRLLEEALNSRGLPSPFTTNKLQGGLISMAQGGEFSGMVPGQGGGMDDNVFMPIQEGNKQVGTLAVSPTEYVVDSYTMAALGDGNPSEGAKVMDRTVKQIRQKAYGTMKQPNEIDGLQALKPMMRRV